VVRSSVVESFQPNYEILVFNRIDQLVRIEKGKMTTRATKSGFAAEAQSKILGKYDAELGAQVLQWIAHVSEQSIDTNGDHENFIAVLKDGTLLCALANALQAGSIKKINTSSMAFKQMENIQNFLQFVENVAGVPKHESFQTVDLFEGQDPNSVLVCLTSLARKADKFGKPTLGPREAQGEKRDWSEEQLRASDGVIGLQMGSNKGATQSGLNFGNTRHIILNK
jgi:hypothetical protein